MFSGSIPALVTPFRDGAFDEAAFRKLVDWQIDNGSSALVPCGTTGENSTLSNAEHHRVIEVCVEQAAALVVAPYYNRPSQDGLLAHFSYLAEHADLPIVLYNVPGRTVTDLQPETVCELARRYPDTFVGIKDASGDLSRVTDHRMGIGKKFVQLSGDDELALPFNAAGGVGCISVTANVAPSLCAQFQAACAANDLELARELNDRLYPLHYAMFEDSSPGPCKYALARVHDWMANELRLPLVPCGEKARNAVDAALEHAGLL
jgi:4-hydroxy-tetrahydrodipicolinate synthase